MNLDDVISLALQNAFTNPDAIYRGSKNFDQVWSRGQTPHKDFNDVWNVKRQQAPVPQGNPFVLADPETFLAPPRDFDRNLGFAPSRQQPPPMLAQMNAPPPLPGLSDGPLDWQPPPQIAPPPIQEPMPMQPSSTPVLDALALVRSPELAGTMPPDVSQQNFPLTAILQSIGGERPLMQGEYDQAQAGAFPENRRAASFMPTTSRNLSEEDALREQLRAQPPVRNQSFRDPNFYKYQPGSRQPMPMGTGKSGPAPFDEAAYAAAARQPRGGSLTATSPKSDLDQQRVAAYKERTQGDLAQRQANVTANAQARQRVSELMKGFGLNRQQAQQVSGFGDRAHEVALAMTNPKAAAFLQRQTENQAKQALDERKANAAEDMVLAELVKEKVLTPEQAQQRMAARNPTPSQQPQVGGAPQAVGGNAFSDRFAAAKADPFFVSLTQNPMYHALNRENQADFEDPAKAAQIRNALQQQWGDNWMAEFEKMTQELGGGPRDAEKINRWRRTLLGTPAPAAAPQASPPSRPYRDGTTAMTQAIINSMFGQ